MSKTRMGKRVASLLLSLVMMLSLLPTTVYAEGADTGDTTDEIVGQATTSGDNTEGTGEPEPTGEGEDGSANVTEGEDGAATNDAVVEETIAPVNAEGVDAVANAESSGDEVSDEDGNGLVNFVTVNGDSSKYETLEAAIKAATPDANGVITYNISGKVSVTATGWVQVAKAGLAGLTAVKFVGKTVDAGICINGGLAILADQNYDIDVSFESLTLSKPNPAYGGDYGHSTNYFTTWLRNSSAEENTVTYTNCTFPNGVCNNQYGKTVFDNCQFTNKTTKLYNLWVYGGNVELNGGTFTGVRGAKVYTEGTPETVPAVTIKDTSFDGLTEKAAIVVSKAATVTLDNVSATDCNKGLFQKAIEGSSNEEEVVIAPSGTNVSGTFVVDGNKGVGKADKRNFNISAGTFTSKVSNDYLAEGLTIGEDGTVKKDETSTAVAKIGDKEYATLKDAIAAAQDGQTVTLLANTTEDVTINKNITLDLGGKTLTNTNAGKATISVSNGATATVKNGSVVGGTSYYNIEVTKGSNANLTLEDVTATTGNTDSSMIDNWGTLTINSGTYTGGLNVVKSEEGSKLTITGGKFTLEYATSGYTGVVFAYGDTTISGGEFIQSLKTTGRWNHPTVILTGVVEGYTAITRVTGGHFVNMMSEEGIFRGVGKGTSDNFEVSGGTFNKSVPDSYCADGFIPTKNTDNTYGVKQVVYVAETNNVKYETLQAAIDAATRNQTVKLLADTRENVTIDKALTLDLNGFTLNGSTGERKPALTITARIVTVMDSSEAQTGTIKREDTAKNSGVSSHYVIDIQGNAWVIFKSGTVENGSGAGGTKGASLVRVGDDSVEENPGLVINGGTFTQDNFIVIKVDRGYLNLNGGTLKSANSYAVENWFNANIKGGTVNGAVSSWTYSGGSNSTLTISGGTVNGDVESVSYDGAEGKLAKVKITGGTVNGTLSTKRYSNATAPSKDIATIEVTGGTFKEDPTKYLVECSTVTPNTDGTYGVAKAYLARIGETFYYTMEDAFQAQTNGDTIVLLRDYTTGGTFNSGSINRTVDLNGHTWTCTGTDANSAAFEINYPNASLTVKNGKIVSSQLVGLIPSAMGGTIKYDNSSLTFENVEMSTTATSGIETNGNNTSDTVTLKDSTLNVPNGFGIYFPSSGTLTIDNSTINVKTMGVQVCAGSLSINAGSAITVSGDAVSKTENDGAIQDGAAISIVNRAGYKGLGDVTVTGGKFTAKTGNAAIKAYGWENNTETDFKANDKVSVSGGTFSSAVPEGLCKEGYIPVANDNGTHTVKKGVYVAKVDNVKYESLAAAIGAAQDGDTVTLLADIDLPATAVVEGKTITLELNGKTLANTKDIWDIAPYDWSLISVREGGNLTINGSGALRAKENDCYALDVQDGGNLTVNGDASYVGNIHAIYVQKGTATVNGGSYSVQQKYPDAAKADEFVLNCYDANRANGTAKIIVNGGTFTNFDPRNNKAEGTGTSFVAEGVGVNSENGTFTAVPKMAAQIIAADGSSVKAYAGHYDAIAAAKDGETVILLSDRKNFVTNTINANITIDLNGKTLSVGNNNPFFRTNGEVTIQNGTIESNYACAIVNAYNKLTLKNVKITGVTGDSGKNLVNVCSNAEVTIDKDTVLTASGSGVAVFIGQAADAKYTLNVYGKVIQQKKSYAISGNGSYEGATTINIYEGAEVRSASVAIYHPQAGEINVYGGLVEGYCGIGIKSGTLNITGGQVLGVGDDDELSDKNSNPNGMTYDGSAIIIDSRAAYAGNVKINISGDALVQSSYSTAIREIGESAETTNVTALNVTGGKVLGASGKAAIQLHGVTADVTSISGGTFSSKVPPEYCAPGYVPTGEDADGRFTVAEGKFTVQVTSRTVSSASPVAHVSGGGNITYAEGTTATTTTVAGYEFVGWYVDNYPDGEYLGKELTISYNPTADCTLVAVYEPISGGTFELKVDASKFKVNGGATNTSKFSAKLAANSLVTIKFTGDNFLYWVNGSGKVVSTLTEYTFTLVSATVLSAVYTNSEADEAQVIFLTANPDDPNSAPQIVSSRAYAKHTTTISFPAPPVRIGKSFTGWSMTEEQIIAAIPGANVERGGKILVYAMYEDQKLPCTVTVFYGDRQQEIPATIGTRVELTAPQQVDGKEFSYWKDSEGKVLGTTSKLYVTPVGNMTVYAVYGETVEQLPTISMLKPVASVANEKYVVTFSAVRSIPNGYTIEELGILYSMDSGYGNSDAKKYMVLGSDGEVPAGVYRARATQTTPLGTVRCNITTGFADRTFYARGYMILKDSEGNIAPYYSEIASGSYNSLTNGGN